MEECFVPGLLRNRPLILGDRERNAEGEERGAFSRRYAAASFSPRPLIPVLLLPPPRLRLLYSET